MIQENELMMKLKKSKNIMDKSDSIPRNVNDVNGYQINESSHYNEPTREIPTTKLDYTPDAVMRSNLPESIKQVMINKPITKQIPNLNNGLSAETVNRFVNENKEVFQQKIPSYHNTTNQQLTLDSIVTILQPIVENSVRKVLAEMKNEDIFSNLNEELVLKVGDSIFKGKILGHKKK